MIVYFSGTGNSKYIASKLANKLKDNLISLNDRIKHNDNSSIEVNGNLIIVTPTYAWRIPKIVYNHISESEFKHVKNVYFVMSCGGEIGNAAKYNKMLCSNMNLNYKGSIGVLMPDNYIIMFKSPKKDECIELINKVDEKIKEISTYILEDKEFPKPRNNLYDRLMSSYVNKQFYRHQIDSKGFIVNEKCTKCLKCVKDCPLNNIKLIDNKITYGAKCTHCMHCISYCPVNAINYKNKTKGKKPYKIEDYINN